MQLLKYDFRGLFSYCLPAYALTLLGGLWNLILGFFLDNHNESIPETVYFIGEVVYSATSFFIYLLVVATAIWLVTDFYKTVFGKIGYLTHTLPVSAEEILFSKVISSFVAFTLSSLLSGAISFLLSVQREPFYWDLLKNEPQLVSLFLVGLLTYLCATLLQLLLLFTAIALGHLTKHKIPWSIAYYLGLYHIVGNIPMFIMFFYVFSSELFGMVDVVMYAGLVYSGASLLLCPILFLGIVRIMKRKLNLE